ncbi:hypothetical protein MTR_8g026870 [Medicago truncatula]|uniref:Uncharacterized protein n=1 Tax=Medicago truncatula TaxID=3880 RepID=G7LAS5_MEDTR|nr:hypothetical protein MTR_8g026870 [Medicago truncatula]
MAKEIETGEIVPLKKIRMDNGRRSMNMNVFSNISFLCKWTLTNNFDGAFQHTEKDAAGVEDGGDGGSCCAGF